MSSKVFEVNDGDVNRTLESVLNFINEKLNNFNINSHDLRTAQLMAEESLISLVSNDKTLQNLNQDSQSVASSIIIKVNIKKTLFGDIKLDLIVSGNEFDFLGKQTFLSLNDFGDNDDVSPELLNTARSCLLKSFSDKIQYSHFKDSKVYEFNRVIIHAASSRYKMTYLTLTAFILAVVAGVFLKNILSPEIIKDLDNNILVPFRTMFLNVMQLSIAPLVFFSIALCVSQFENFGEMGKVGGDVIKFFALSTCAATLVGIGVFNLLGSFIEFGSLSQGSDIISKAASGISIKDFMINIVPSNFLRPFIERNMMQLIVIAVLSGVAVILSGKFASAIRSSFEAANEFFSQLTNLILKLIPLGTFCAIFSMTLNTGLDTFKSLAVIVGIVITGLLCVLLIYCLAILFIAKLKPSVFISKYFPSFLDCVVLCSSTAAIPINLKACEALGASKKIYSLLVPLGATMHKAPSCIDLSVCCLAVAKMYGIEISGSGMLSVFIFVFVLSVAAAGSSGGGFASLMILFAQLGIPAEGIAILMGIDPILDMLITGSNCMCNVAGAVILSKRSGNFNEKVYNS